MLPNGSLAETYKSSRRRKGGEFHSDPGDARIFSAYIFPETVWLEGNVRKRAICLFCDGPGIECGKNKSGSDGGAKTVENPVTDAGGKFHPDMGRDKTTGNTNGWKEIFISIWDDACGKKKRFRRCARQAPEPLFASCTEKKSRIQSRKSGSRMTISLPSIAMMPSSCMRDSSLESALRSA